MAPPLRSLAALLVVLPLVPWDRASERVRANDNRRAAGTLPADA